MSGRLERALRRLGPAGVLALGVLLACGGFYHEALAPLEATLSAEAGGARAAARENALHRPVSAQDADDDLERFYELFPSAAALGGELERLHDMARKNGLELAHGEYQLERRPEGLWAYRITLPVHGSYAQLRGFLSAVLVGMPAASIDALSFQRKKPLDTQLEAQVRLTLHARPLGDSK